MKTQQPKRAGSMSISGLNASGRSCAARSEEQLVNMNEVDLNIHDQDTSGDHESFDNELRKSTS